MFSSNPGEKSDPAPQGEASRVDQCPDQLRQCPLTVSAQITDAVTQANVASLGIGPAFAIVQSFLAQSQAQSVLFANMVQEHQQLGTAGLAATVQSVIQLLGVGGGKESGAQ
ncbi:MAG TPA: RebB family R body protein [Alphaproteobacteria bacterium]|nr:RebB family R body protein [Alphaproteobacteria bacterium]